MRVYLLGIALLATSCPVWSVDHDWKFYGAYMGLDNEAVDAFYEQNSIEVLPNGNLKVWIKGLPAKQIDRNPTSKDKGLIDRAARKLLAHYVPPYLAIKKTDLTLNDLSSVITLEEIADESSVSLVYRFQYEINCRDNTLRQLSVYLSFKHKIGNSDRVGDWSPIAPETMPEGLAALVCQKL